MAKKEKFQIIISLYNNDGKQLFSKPQGTFGTNKRFIYASQKDAEEEVKHLKEMTDYPNIEGHTLKFEIKPA